MPALRVAPPPRELPARELLERRDVTGELGREGVENRFGKLRLGRGWRLRVMDDLLDHPAHPLRKPVEVPVEGAESRELDQLLHELISLGFLRARLLPLALELLGGERRIDPGVGKRLPHGPLAIRLELLLGDHLDL